MFKKKHHEIQKDTELSQQAQACEPSVYSDKSEA